LASTYADASVCISLDPDIYRLGRPAARRVWTLAARGEWGKIKNPIQVNERGFKIGVDLLLHPLGALPLALPGLTALFGMGRGDPRRYRHHKLFGIR
jgi:hypothetical protein